MSTLSVKSTDFDTQTKFGKGYSKVALVTSIGRIGDHAIVYTLAIRYLVEKAHS